MLYKWSKSIFIELSVNQWGHNDNYFRQCPEKSGTTSRFSRIKCQRDQHVSKQTSNPRQKFQWKDSVKENAMALSSKSMLSIARTKIFVPF